MEYEESDPMYLKGQKGSRDIVSAHVLELNARASLSLKRKE